MKTRPLRHWTEYVRQITWFLVGAILFERAFPTPWLQSVWGKVLYAAIVVYVIKGFVEYRQSKSARFYARTQRIAGWVQGKMIPMPPFLRYRLGKVWQGFVAMMAVGFIVDQLTASCVGPLNCAVSIPSMLINNMQDFIWFVIRLAMGFGGIFLTTELVSRTGWGDVTLPHSIKTRFSDVYGQDKAVASVKEALDILNKPEEVESLGGFMPTGILVFGPPGVGKSYLMEAAAGEAGKPFISIDGTSFSSMWKGVGPRRVKFIFKKIRSIAIKYGGCVVFFDEIDVLGSRSGGFLNTILRREINEDTSAINFGQGSGELQQLLTELSGMKRPRGFYNKVRVWFGLDPKPPVEARILWTAATNLPEVLDSALTREGRFDRKIKMGYPTLSGKVETIRGYLNKIAAYDLSDKDMATIAREMGQASGARIKTMVNEALLAAVRDNRAVVTLTDLRSYLLHVEMGDSEGQMERDEDKYRTAVHEAAHAIMSHYKRPEAPMQFVSVERRGKTGGFVKAVDDTERYTTKRRLYADIMVSLASTWAEKYYFDDNVSTGPSSDLEKASQIADRMWFKFAMGDTVYVHDDGEVQPERRATVEDWLNEVYVEVDAFMLAHKDQVELLAQMLMEFGTVEGHEVHALLERLT